MALLALCGLIAAAAPVAVALAAPPSNHSTAETLSWFEAALLGNLDEASSNSVESFELSADPADELLETTRDEPIDRASTDGSDAVRAEPTVKPIETDSSATVDVAVEECQPPGDLEATADCQSLHQIWLISSRAIRSCGDLSIAAQRLRYWRYEPGHGWLTASHEEFLAGDDPAMPTVLYVHGHRVDPEYAREGGWEAYRAFVKPSAVPTRFVIWSWPTTPNGRPLEDFRIKADASEVHSYYLAWLIDRMQPSVPVHLVGYSYGARLITGSLHLLGGGMLMGRVLDERVHAHRVAINASLLAAALDNDWLLPGRHHGQALSQVDRMFITRNPIDPVLHYYPVVLREPGAMALGVSGFAGLSRLGDERYKVQQLNVSCSVGRHHTITRYWQSGRVRSALREMTILEQPDQVAQNTSP